MTGRKQINRCPRPNLGRIRESLRAAAEISPARLELERRRLLDTVRQSEGPADVANRTSFYFKAASAAAVAVVLIFVGFEIFQSETVPQINATPQSPHQISGLLERSELDAFVAGRPAHVPSGAGAKIVWSNQTAIWAAEEATLLFESVDLSVVRFEGGRMLAAVSKVQRGSVFRVRTPHGQVVVHGTVFSLRGDAKQILVRLHEGAVTFEYGEKALQLLPGYELEIKSGVAPIIRPIDDIGVLADLMIAEKTQHLAGPAVPILGRHAVMSPMDVVADKPILELSPPEHLKHKPKAPSPTAASVPEGAPPLFLAVDAQHLFVDPESADIEVESEYSPDKTDWSSWMEALIRQGRFAECVDAAEDFRRASQNSSALERIQFLKGYCQTRSGNLRAGREAFEKYLIQFPEGRYWKRVSNILGE